MADSSLALFTDDEVSGQVLRVLKEAKEYAIVVSPYVGLFEDEKRGRKWGHAQNIIEEAVRRGAKLAFYVREDWARKDEAADDLRWLARNSVTVMLVPHLHAKIYLNESMTVVSSMNLTGTSAQNSREFAMVVQEPETIKAVRAYVERLKKAAEPFDMWLARFMQEHGMRVPSPTILPQRVVAQGVCIRCGCPISPDPNRPLCASCYDSWAEYRNEDYEEHFCLICGCQAEVSYRRPLCAQCYRAYPR